MLDLKPYYDAVNAANVEVLKIANAIDALFQEGSDESKDSALAMRPALDEAQKKAADAAALYESLKKATASSNVAENFVPGSQTPASPEEDKTAGVKNRAEFNALDPKARLAFINGGGKIE